MLLEGQMGAEMRQKYPSPWRRLPASLKGALKPGRGALLASVRKLQGFRPE